MLKIGAAAVIVALLAILLWIAAEMHYGNCIDAAKAYPDPRPKLERRLDDLGGAQKTPLSDRLDGCSRLPF